MDNIWNEMHEKLQQSMKKEIETMREILSNMHQEETLLQSKDKNSWNKIMEERATLILRLSNLREERLQAAEKLETLSGSPDDTPLEELLSPQDEKGCETLSLRDQMVALVERLNLQSNRIEMLSKSSQEPKAQLEPEAAKPLKRKISIATLPPKE